MIDFPGKRIYLNHIFLQTPLRVGFISAVRIILFICLMETSTMKGIEHGDN